MNEKSGNSFIIQKAPCNTLKECLAAYSKEQLYLLALAMGLGKENKINSMKKEALVTLIENRVSKNLHSIFRLLGPEFFSCAKALAQDSNESQARELYKFKKIYKDDFEDFVVSTFQDLQRCGIAFLFRASPKSDSLMIIPDDIRKIINDLNNQLMSEKYMTGDLEEFLLYAELLASLYGNCPIDIFMQIYNRDYPEKKLTDNLEVAEILKAANCISEYMYFKDNQIISNEIPHKEWLKYIEADRKNFKPYIPSKKELEDRFYLEDYDETLPALNECIKFFTNILNDEDYATNFVYTFFPMIKLHYSIKEVMDCISTNEDVVFEKESVTKLLEILQNLYNTCHAWSNWGHTAESGRDENGSYSKSVFNDDFFEEQRKLRENRPHINLPDTCIIPTKKEVEKRQKQFDNYWGKNEFEPEWHKTGDSQINRIKKDIQKARNTLNKFPKELVNMLMDEWLASNWHSGANRDGDFGNQKWNYYAFEIAEKIRDNLYTCLLPDGSPIVVSSKSVQELFEDNVMTAFGVLVDMGGWYMVYGPLLWWKGIHAKDIEALASSVASQMFELKGLSEVVQFNPIPFWCAYEVALIPPVAHKGSYVIQCLAETRFTAELPDEIKSKWKHETAGKYERWVFNKDDYLASASIFLDTKTGTVLLLAFNEKLFDEILEKLSECIDKRHLKEDRMSMIMASVIKDNSKRLTLLNKIEAIFNKEF